MPRPFLRFLPRNHTIPRGSLIITSSNKERSKGQLKTSKPMSNLLKTCSQIFGSKGTKGGSLHEPTLIFSECLALLTDVSKD